MGDVVYAAGPANSGTRMLFDLLGKLGFTAVHAALPGHDEDRQAVWWSVEDLQARYGPGRWVIITREPGPTAESAVRRGYSSSTKEAIEIRWRALMALEEIDNPYRLTYEDFVADPKGQTQRLADWLGVPTVDPGTIYDGNARYAKAEPAPEKPRKLGRRKKT